MRETELYDTLKFLPSSTSVVLASRELGGSYLRLEMAHALWEQSPFYREASRDIARRLPQLEATKELLSAVDYTAEHLENELQAFAAAGTFIHGLPGFSSGSGSTVRRHFDHADYIAALNVYQELGFLMEAELAEYDASFKEVERDIIVNKRFWAKRDISESEMTIKRKSG